MNSQDAERQAKRAVFDALKSNGFEQDAIQAGQIAAALNDRVVGVAVRAPDGTVTKWGRI